MNESVAKALKELQEFDEKAAKEKERLEKRLEVFQKLEVAFPTATALSEAGYPADYSVTLPEAESIAAGKQALQQYALLPMFKVVTGTCIFTHAPKPERGTVSVEAVEPIVLCTDNFHFHSRKQWLEATAEMEGRSVKLRVAVPAATVDCKGRFDAVRQEWGSETCKDTEQAFSRQVRWKRTSKEYFPDFTLYNVL